MITAPWGAGKSYFIKYIFTNYLSEHSSKKCITVSLYSIRSIESLCRAILMESKFKIVQTGGRISSVAGLIGKTVYHGVSSYMGFDLGASEEDYRKLFDSFNLSDDVIILEDLERTEIPIQQLMGFVNNLTEIDGIKVILVANEREIIDNMNQLCPQYDKIKEKTVYDTFYYDSNSVDVVRAILGPCLMKVSSSIGSDSSLYQEIIDLRREDGITHINYRSIQYSALKIELFFDNINDELDLQFVKHIVISSVAYSLKKRENADLEWSDVAESSEKMGSTKYPLFRFVYDYFENHVIDKESVLKANRSFVEQKQFQESMDCTNKKINILFSFHLHWESEVLESLDYLLDDNNMKIIPLQELIRLYGCMIAIGDKHIADELVKQCKDKIRIQLEKSDYVPQYWQGVYTFESKEAQIEWNEFKQYIVNLNEYDRPLKSLDYTVEGLKNIAKSPFISKNHCFIKLLDIDSIVKMVRSSSPAELDEIRSVLLGVYDPYFSDSNLKDDLSDLKKLKEQIDGIRDDTLIDKI